MTDSSTILARLEELGIPVIGSLVKDAASSGYLYVFVEVIRNADNRQVPSNQALERAKDGLAELGIVIDFVLIDGQLRDAEAGLRATMLHSFGYLVRNVFLSTEGGSANVWLDPKADIDQKTLGAMKEKAEVFLREVGLDLRGINSTTAEKLPSKTACLRAIRELSPVTPARLAEFLREKGFVVPSADWMARRLDVLRKAGVVTWLQGGRYALSVAGLINLGTAKNATSPDVKRLLALAFGGH